MTASYQRPKKSLHRSFAYLDDDAVTNSLSMLEAGKIDEVVAKGVTAKEGGGALRASLGFAGQGISGEGAKKSSTSLEEEITRTRTRFSIYQAWEELLVANEAMGTFDGWGGLALNDVRPGDTVNFFAQIELHPLQLLFRLYEWFAAKASESGTIWSQKGEELRTTKETLKNLRGISGEDSGSFILRAEPDGDPGPNVSLNCDDRWLINSLGTISGRYQIVGQVQEVLSAGDKRAALRLTTDAPPTKLEVDQYDDMVQEFIIPGKHMGVEIKETDASFVGPHLVIEPIAIMR